MTPKTALLSLTQGKFAIIDQSDFAHLSKHRWHFSKWPSERGEGYAICSITDERTGKRQRVRLHRMIMEAQSKQDVDHRNGNGLDNRRENLRLCSRSQNLGNTVKRKGKLSIYKGVCPRNGYVAYGYSKGKYKHLGFFKNEIDAARAYNSWAIETFGEFAKLNDVPTAPL